MTDQQDHEDKRDKVVQIATLAYGDAYGDGPYVLSSDVLVALTQSGEIYIRDIAKSSTEWALLDPPMPGINVSSYHASVPSELQK